LMGYNDGSRSSIFARRAAPIQVNYLGYPGTTGADYMDYILADETIIPDDQFSSYSERVVWLPDSYQVNDQQRRISEHRPTRSECGLPDMGFVFCCFNNTYKITPEIFDVWMRLLKAAEASVLWLLDANPIATQNLRREAEQRGVSSERLIFAPRMPLPGHLARHQNADLLLDTVNYNAHTTSSDALWAGVPVVTCLGSTFSGRVAASLLKAAGLPELITHSLAEYETLALKLAHDASYIEAIKGKLARNRNTCALFDTERFARHVEAAFTTMWERYQRREAPQAFAV
jgi:protein O-GlcNAc transferase